SAEQAATAAKAQALQERNKAVAEKQRADTEAATAKAVNDFLQNDLLAKAGASAQSSPGTKPDPDLKVRTALDRAAAGITGKFDGQPLVEASIRQTIGSAYLDLGLYPRAQHEIERAVELRRVAGEEHNATLESQSSLSNILQLEGKYAQAEDLYSRVLATRRRLLGERHRDTLSSMNALASVFRQEGKHKEARSLLDTALEVQRGLLG